MIRYIFLRVSRLIWRLAPWPPARRFLYGALVWLLRGRKVRAAAYGIAFDLDLSESIDVGIFLEGYEKDVRAAIDRHCQEGAVALDIGANVGAHALYLAKKAGEFGSVYAFEPADYAFGKLERNIALNPFTNLKALKMALSDVSTEAMALTLRSSWRTDRSRLEERAVVRCTRMDDWCRNMGLRRVDMIKLDVDGKEFAILHGGESVITRDHPIIILEVGAWHFEQDSTNPLFLLSNMDYEFEDAATGTRFTNIESIRRKLPTLDPEMTFSINVVARRLDAAERGAT